MLQRITRPQHTGTHIVEDLSAAMSALAGCECTGLYTGNGLARISAIARQDFSARGHQSEACVTRSRWTVDFGWEYDSSEDRSFRVLNRIVSVEDLVDMRHVDQRSCLVVHRGERDLPA